VLVAVIVTVTVTVLLGVLLATGVDGPAVPAGGVLRFGRCCPRFGNPACGC
jgi:hypothetical protein